VLALHAGDDLRGGVGGVFHDLVRLAVQIEDRVVGCLNPDILATLADALVFSGLVLATIEACSERGIGAAVTLGGRHEYPVMPALDFTERIASAPRKFWLAVMIVPSMLNSITACDLLIASAWASASRPAELLHHCIV
jgi:hypothetical protein